jgi:protein TonB
MIRYNMPIDQSRREPAIPLAWRAGGAATQRSRVLPSSDRRAPVVSPVAISMALHAGVLITLLLLSIGRTMPPISPEPEAVSMVFEAAPAALPQPPATPAPAAAPEPATVPPPSEPTPPAPQTPPPQPASPPIPTPPPPVPVPSPEAAPPTPAPPPPEAQPVEPLPLPPVPPPPSAETPQPQPPAHAVEPQRLARHPPPPRPSVASPRPAQAPVAAPAPVEAPPGQAAPAGAPAAPAAQAAISANWQSALGAWLQTHKTYPEAARRRGDQGRATVRFTVDRNGQVVAVQLLSGTGSAILDEAVQRLLQGARVPAFPAGMDEPQVTVTLQLRYALEP